MSRPRVVLVDDVAAVRTLVRARLQATGACEVVGEGATGLDAVRLAGELRPAVMLLDVSMPELDGLGALPRVLAASPGTRVLVYSGFEEEGLAEKARSLGALDFVQKSGSLDEVVDAVVRAGRLPDGHVAAPVEAAAPEPASASETAVLDQHVERFREVFEEAAIGMATMTLQGRVVRANRALGGFLGRSQQSLVGVEYGEAVGDVAGVHGARERIVAGAGDVVQVEHPQSAGVYLRSTISAVRDGDGVPLYLFAQCQDVTEQRSAEEELRASERKFRLLVEAVEGYAIFMLDPDGHIASWNSGAQRAKGWTEEEILGRHFRIFYPEEQQRSRHPEHELELALEHGSYREEGWRVRKDGTQFWADVLITTVRDENGNHQGFAKVTHDHTERRRMLQQLEDSASALAAANTRLAQAAEDQAQFLAVTAHELRTPATVLGAAGRTLAEHWSDLPDIERAEILSGLRDSAGRLERLVSDLLTTSRLQASTLDVRPEPLDLATALGPVLDSLRRTHRGLELRADLPLGVLVQADPDRLAQIVENLVGNAVRHGSSPVQVGVATVGTKVELMVRDAGPGVSAEMQPRLFERFHSRGAGGTGLGLHIVRELARAQGGDAGYDAQANVFLVRLPGATGIA